jgi:cation/acetate symporter
VKKNWSLFFMLAALTLSDAALAVQGAVDSAPLNWSAIGMFVLFVLVTLAWPLQGTWSLRHRSSVSLR